MQLRIVEYKGQDTVVLLDDEMRIVKPVYEYLKFLQQMNRAFNTIKANARDLKIFWEFLNEMGLSYDEVVPRDIVDYIDYLRTDGFEITALYKESKRTAKTINRMLSTVHMFYIYQANIMEIDNPLLMREVNRSNNMYRSLLYHARTNNKINQSIFKVKESEYVPKLVSDEDMEKVLSRLTKRRDILLYKLLYLSGARIQEALDLEILSIPPVTPGLIENSKGVVVLENIKSKGKYRNLYVPTSLIVELDDFIMNERSLIDTDSDYLFVSEQKQHLGKKLTYSAAYDKLKKVQQEVDVNFNFHDLRHTFDSSLAEMGLDISVISLLMGHKHLDTTKEYTHLSQRYVTNKLAAFWNKSILVN